MNKAEKIREEYLEARLSFDCACVKNNSGNIVGYLSKSDGPKLLMIGERNLTIEEAIRLKDWLTEMLKDVE